MGEMHAGRPHGRGTTFSLFALPPRVLVAGRLQCGAARAGVRRVRGECAELAHLARGSRKNVIAQDPENGPFSRVVGQNTIIATYFVHTERE